MHTIRDYIPVRPKAYIDPAKCAGIDVCAKVCPVNAISGDVRSTHVVDQEKCIGCRMCESRCPKKAITMVRPVVASADHKIHKKTSELVGA
jgi:Fe-S-cluster-containing hydrogenase component 2